jgi:hypothetical protein
VGDSPNREVAWVALAALDRQPESQSMQHIPTSIGPSCGRSTLSIALSTFRGPDLKLICWT